MFRLPTTPPGTYKIVLHIYEPKGANRIEMIPRPEIDLQGKPDLITWHAYDHNGSVLKSMAFEKEWVDYDAARHIPENFQPAPSPTPASVGQHLPPRASKKPIPKAGLDAVHEEDEASPNGGKVVSARVSNHVEPKQTTAPPQPLEALTPMEPLTTLELDAKSEIEVKKGPESSLPVKKHPRKRAKRISKK